MITMNTFRQTTPNSDEHHRDEAMGALHSLLVAAEIENGKDPDELLAELKAPQLSPDQKLILEEKKIELMQRLNPAVAHGEPSDC